MQLDNSFTFPSLATPSNATGPLTPSWYKTLEIKLPHKVIFRRAMLRVLLY
jgi:hypothetical protein